jgi:AP endonuclease-2
LDARVRNLVAAGKRVFLCGDLNIIRDEMDTAKMEEVLRKQGITMEEYLSTPARRMLNQLVVGGKVIGEREEGREAPVMWDICRSFHPNRQGMFTCWEQKINARPGNYGSRIDYVLCSEDWKDWFCESNIQEGLMGSDHCPVYAILKEKVEIQGKEVDVKDIMSDGMFKGGVKQREWSTKDLLPMSAKLIPEFDRRRSIRDMFTKKPSPPAGDGLEAARDVKTSFPARAGVVESNASTGATQDMRPLPVEEYFQTEAGLDGESQATDVSTVTSNTLTVDSQASSMPSPVKPSTKRSNESSSAARPQKRGKSTSTSKSQPGKGQSSLMGFFKPKAPQKDGGMANQTSSTFGTESDSTSVSGTISEPPTPAASMSESISFNEKSENLSPNIPFDLASQKTVVDPIVSKESWSKLLGKRVVPRCEHNEPCISYTTKKPGVNCGRSFYMCPRPLGPSGQKEKNTQWRCGTFIWSSDWTGDGT